MKKSIFALFAFAFPTGLAFAQPAGAVFCPDSDVLYVLELNLESNCFLDYDDEPTGVDYFVEDLDDQDNFACSFPSYINPGGLDFQLGPPTVTNDSTTYHDFPTYGLQTQAVCMKPGNKHRLWVYVHEQCFDDEDFNDQVVINTEDMSSDTLIARSFNHPGDYVYISVGGGQDLRFARVFDFIAPSTTPIPPAFVCADLNGDSFINTADLGILLSQYGFQCE